MDIDKKLSEISSKLLGHKFPLLSDNPDDYPKKFPKWLLKEISELNNNLRVLAIEISKLTK